MAKKPVKPKSKAQDPEKKARVHKELEGFEIGVKLLVFHLFGFRAGQFGEKTEEVEDEEFPIQDGHHEPEPEETDEEFMKRTSREAKRKKSVDDPDTEAAQTRKELPADE